MVPYLSIIIPYFNNPDSLERLLTSIKRSKNAPSYEVIIVDDGSREEYIVDRLSFIAKAKRKTNTRLRRQDQKRITIRLKANQGPAIARNRGVSKARGKFVVFLDCDVEVFPDTLHNLAKVFEEDPDVVALTGVWVKEQRSHDFFPNYKALRDWSYWINERDKSGYYYLFSTRIASIKRSVFVRLGGFDETYPAPLVEDIELTYRIARRYAIIFAPQVRVRHEFESFWPVAKKYFLRAYYWTKLYAKRKKFDPVATTWWEALTTISGVGTVLLGIMSVFLLPAYPVLSHVKCQLSNIFVWLSCSYPFVIWTLSLGILILHLFLVRKFLAFMVKEKGIVFAIKGFFMGLILYCFIFAGALAGRLKHTN